MTSSNSQSALTHFISQVEQTLDQVVDTGSDQELFIASYLQGHFAVMAGQSQVQNMQLITELDKLMQDSLTQAFANNELAPDDQIQVWEFWHSFLSE